MLPPTWWCLLVPSLETTSWAQPCYSFHHKPQTIANPALKLRSWWCTKQLHKLLILHAKTRIEVCWSTSDCIRSGRILPGHCSHDGLWRALRIAINCPATYDIEHCSATKKCQKRRSRKIHHVMGIYSVFYHKKTTIKNWILPPT